MLHCCLSFAHALLFFAVAAAAAAADRPNIVVILSDDQGWGDLSVNGNKNLSTPNVDSLARDGASFDRFYVCPVCSPTRAQFLTGRYHSRGGVFTTSKGGERLDLDESTVAEAFKAAGYATGVFGKWHNGSQFPYHPNARGFDEFYGFTIGHIADYYTPMLDHNGEIVRGEKYLSDDFTDKAIEFIEGNRSRPFFAYVAYNSPHSPMQVPDKWWNAHKSQDLQLRGTQPELENIDHTRAALAMCENVDWNVGRILEALKEQNLADNTIVVYFCDNGPNGNRWNGGMKGVKGSTDEGGVRSPLFIRWPGHIQANTHIAPSAAAIDLLPTLTNLAGIPRVGEKPLDGVSLKPLLLKSLSDSETSTKLRSELRDRSLFFFWAGKTSARYRDFRLDHEGHLYNVQRDPAQQHDLAEQRPKLAARLRTAAQKWERQMRDELDVELGVDNRPFVIGGAPGKHSHLPAADGIGHGNVRWSNIHPNTSYFTNWTSLDDRITWNVEVAESGEYEVELHYTCPAADVGSEIEITLNAARLAATIAEPFDPPIRGAEHDRIPRVESYTKDFRPLKLGKVRLEKGPGTLTVRALKIPGNQAADVSQIELRRVD